ncbi:serine acetyltransferase [Echinicola strongylocentroti]|uniref:Serine acetyltransferase n=1 Tax=Echinicola strongylocentroti TaxID=1795355 RepID=A0A2Z4IH20_9BACT|nr:serine acetyltransferase [Echinicola strongylocentroti]AWW30007.1 serine acetyltransferase [Echinicola strongylocentroti]
MEHRELFIDKIHDAHKQCPDCPSPKRVQEFFEGVLGILFPEYAVKILQDKQEIADRLQFYEVQLQGILGRNKQLIDADGEEVAHAFFVKLSDVYDAIQEDVEAMFEGDPAANSKTEVIRSYPGFYAIAAYRIAHLLQEQGVALIPRMITEFAHSKTGIDIHPGAEIGRYFCIDHGTGVVVGETTRIGDHVKLYQGVTLGALSVNKEDADIQRHPTIENHVVIYAGATILGGKTVIGAESVIGGNVWLTKSIPAKSKIYYQTKMYDASAETTDMYVFKNDA